MLITNANLITFDDENRIFNNGAIYIENDTIVDIGDSLALQKRYPAAEKVDAGGKIVMPGFICAHTHFYGAFARGLYMPGPAPRTFPEILAKLWWRLDKSLDKEGIRYSALVSLVNAIRHGTTTLFDHHASPLAVNGSLDVIAKAVTQAGVRATLCYEVSDRDGADIAEAGIAENLRFIQRTRQEKNPLLAATFGLHASLTLSDETLELCAAEANALGNTGFHIHAAEGNTDEDDSLAKYGLRTIDRLAKRGILGPRTIVAHAVAVDPWEMELLRDSGTWVTHQPRSNMNNAVGVADVPAMLRGGIKVGLGNDGFSNNMFTEMHTAYLVPKLWSGDPRRLGADQVLELAVYNNRRLAALFSPQPVGILTPGAFADLIFVDYDPPTLLLPENMPWHIIFGLDGSEVTDTMVAGKFLMRNRALQTLDEARIMARSREVAALTWERFWQA